ncbi:MAG TPA: carboxypeptidase-like regulatory domain-containing protein [Candidatus Acidoferrum sp.]|nr:carboxypeptidase-like regulatory domain-containing protein [Candidatus Acidoferrum sp.]
MRNSRTYLGFTTLLLVVFLPSLFPQSPAQISGVVLDAAGAIVSDASVTLFSLEKVREARTDRLGQFVFDDLPQDIYELEVRHPGFKTVLLGTVKVSDLPLPQISTTLQLQSPGCGDFQPTASYPKRSGKVNLTGTVKDYSAGFVKDAALTLTLVGSSQGQSVNTNENGEFQFSDVTPGRYYLKVAHEGYYERSVTEFWVTRENLTKLTPVYVFRKNDHRIIICQ